MKTSIKTRISVWFTLLLVAVAGPSYAQYGSEWIVPGQQYVKAQVIDTAMYAVPLGQLSSLGLNVSDPDKIQVWRKGVEQSVRVANGNVYFIGYPNDGELDSLLYQPSNLQPNKYYSLYTDSAAYFITVGAVNGKRWGTVSGSVNTGASTYRMHTALKVYTDEYVRGMEYPTETSYSWGDQGEGWIGPMIYSAGSPASSQQNIALPGFSSGPSLEVEVQISGRNGQLPYDIHVVDITIGSATFSILPFAKRATKTLKVTIPSSAVVSNTLSITVTAKGNPAYPTSPDGIGINYIKVVYPQSNVVSSSYEEWQNPVSSGDSYTILSGAVATGQVLDITQLSDVNLVSSVYSAGNLQVQLPAAAQKLWYHDGTTFASVAAIRTADMSVYPATANFLIITHWKLWASASRYAAYRTSAAGGNYSVLLTDVNKLYNLYSYGDKSPIALRRFCEYQIATGAPKFLFLIGKGLYVDYQFQDASFNYTYYRKDPNGSINNAIPYWKIEDLVPTYGAPGSDIMYSEGLNGRARCVPALATGRYMGKDDASVDGYLDKVMLHESLGQDILWRKHFVHLSGGRNAGEINNFRNTVNNLATIAQGEWFGGHLVVTFSKSVTSTVDQMLKFSLADKVNEGLSYVTFYGHSSALVTDVEIGNPSDPVLGYANEGKYPLLYVNGCMSAASFYSESFSEDWMVTPKKGAIAVIGHADVGYSGSLEDYARYFYHLNFADSLYINKTLGEVQQATVDTFMLKPSAPTDPHSLSTATQMMLYGDPAIRIYKPVKTDYHISGDNEPGDQKAFLHSYRLGDKVTTDVDSFAIGIPVINFGITHPDTVSIHVKRVINNSLTIEYDLQFIDPVYYNDTVYFKIKDNDPSYLGMNYFEIRIDYLNRVDELSENNNLATLNYYMPVAGVTCLLPKEFSIVYNGPTVNLVAQTTDLLLTNTDFYLEFDTTSTFTSPAKKSIIKNSNALIRWDVDVFTDILPSDSVVYYWRVRFNTIPVGQDTLWGNSSFIYIKDSEPGWSQSEIPQFPKDGMNGIHQHPVTGAWEFDNTDRSLYLKVAGNPAGGSMAYEYSPVLKLGSLVLIQNQYDVCATQGVAVLVLDKTTVNYKFPQPLSGCGYNFRPYLVSFASMALYDDGDHTDASYDQLDLINYLNAVDPGDYVLIFNMGNAYYNEWDPALKNLLITDFGAQQLGSLANNKPYYLLAKKGAGVALSEEYANQLDAFIYLDTLLNGTQNTAWVTSTMIGPVTDNWETMYRKVVPEDTEDGYEISIILHNLAEEPIDTISIPQHDTLDLSPLIDFEQYPFIKLQAKLYDSLNLTPPQLKRWQVIYKPAPEGVYNTALVSNTEYTAKLRQEGVDLVITYVFENITPYDFVDSMKVQFTIINNGRIVKREVLTVGKPLAAGEKVTFTYTVNTMGLQGDNVIQAYVNPKLQPEQYYTNNIMELDLHVEADRTNPVVDVTFDGVHILDGDIVSPSPQISIVVNDNNQLLLMNDTTNINLFLIRPGSTTAENIYMSNIAVKQWGQDPGAGNKFTVLYHPENLPDGKYTIIVQGIDKSGNKAGSNTYRITFEVVNKSTITHFYPYPNPFSTSCRFVFTLTGGVIPEDMTIQIMTVTGKVVKEITMAEIGNIHAGNNITEYSWDGTDNFGDRLANGVYLYRVLIKNPGSNFEHRETAGDQAFKKDFGKLYILR